LFRISKISTFESNSQRVESEIILQRGTKFRIIKAEYNDGKYYIDLEVIGQ